MRYLAIGLLFMMAISSYGQMVLAAPQPAFRDLYWGDPPEKLGESTIFYDKQLESPGIELRIKVNDDMQLGPLTATAIVYGFFQNRLMFVSILASDVKMLSEIAKAKYGLPQQSNMFMIDELYIRGDTACSVKENIVDKSGYMTLMSTAMAFEYNRWQQEQAKEASKAF
ncbi:MAG TPA: hypothetical protein GXX51_00485 [Firmicutes bacterium]|nr:hypothetical protein [Bacillota bacterium]